MYHDVPRQSSCFLTRIFKVRLESICLVSVNLHTCVILDTCVDKAHRFASTNDSLSGLGIASVPPNDAGIAHHPLSNIGEAALERLPG